LIYKEFLQKLKNTDRNIFVISGTCEYQKKRAHADVMMHFGFKTDDIDFEALPYDSNESNIISACDSVSFFGSRRMIFAPEFSGLKASKASSDGLNDYLAVMPRSNILLFFLSGKADKRKKLYKTINQLGLVCEFEDLTPKMLEDWIISEFNRYDKIISTKNANLLVDVCGKDMLMLLSEVTKISSYCDNDLIDAKSIEKVASKSLEYNVFKIHELFMKKKTDKGLTLLNEIIEKEKSPFGIMGLLASKIRLLYKAKTLTECGVNQERAIKLMGGHPYSAKIAIDESQNFTTSQLRDAIKLIANLDYKLKSGQTDASLTIENLLLNIYQI